MDANEAVKEALRKKLDGLTSEEAVAAFARCLLTMTEAAHLDVGAKAWRKRIEVEKICGIQHTDEINVWLAMEKERESRT